MSKFIKINNDGRKQGQEIDLDDLTDVDLTGSPAPTSGDILEYDGSNWVHTTPNYVPEAPMNGNEYVRVNGDWQIPSSTVVTLTDLSDVNTTGSPTPANGDLLQYDGFLWVNVTPDYVSTGDNVSSLTNDAGYLTTEVNDLTSNVTWADIPDANVPETAVTQHEAALTITESQISDLQSYLTTEVNDLTASVTWANVPDANITQSSVVQHEAALTITESQISDLGSYLTDITNENIGDLSDVDLTGSPAPVSGDILEYDGSNWVHTTPTFLSSGDNVSSLTNDAGYLTSETNDLTASVTWADIPDVNVPESAVTQHEAALTITESQISDLQSYLTNITNENIGDLSDVDLTGSPAPTNGDVLTYDGTNWVHQTPSSSSGLNDVVDDTTPQLGGNLDVNGNSIVSTSNGDINITPNGTGNVNLGNLTFNADQTVGASEDGYVLTYDDTSGEISLEAASGGGETYVEINSTGTAPTATGTDAIAIGESSSSTGSETIAIGVNADAAVNDNIAIGFNAESNFNARAIGIGVDVNALGSTSVAIGHLANATFNASDGVCIGTLTRADGINAIAIGRGSFADDNYTIAIGSAAEADDIYSVAIGSDLQNVDPGVFDISAGQARNFLSRNKRGRRRSAFFTGSTTNATPKNLELTFADDYLPMNSHVVFSGKAEVVAIKQYDASTISVWEIDFLFRRASAASSSTFLVNTKNNVHNDSVSWDCDLVANTTNGGIEVNVTGQASTNIQWTAILTGIYMRNS